MQFSFSLLCWLPSLCCCCFTFCCCSVLPPSLISALFFRSFHFSAANNSKICNFMLCTVRKRIRAAQSIFIDLNVDHQHFFFLLSDKPSGMSDFIFGMIFFCVCGQICTRCRIYWIIMQAR